MKATIDACFAKKIMEKNNLDYFSVAALDEIIRYSDEVSEANCESVLLVGLCLLIIICR